MGTSRFRRLIVHASIAAVITFVFVTLSYIMKSACVTPELSANGSSLTDRGTLLQYACYTDIQGFWGGRDLFQGIFPYLNGSFTPPNIISGGAIEYPILTGIFIWFSALFAHSDGQFLFVTYLMILPFAIATSVFLTFLNPRRAWLWYAAPALILYSVYNWDILPVAFVVIGFLAILAPPLASRPLVGYTLAAVAFGIGAGFKLYPLMFLVPLCLWILFGAQTRSKPTAQTWREALITGGIGTGVFALINLPFALANFQGWAVPFLFQAQRPIDDSTLSLWFYGFEFLFGGDPTGSPRAQAVLMALSSAATAISLLAVCVIGYLRYRQGEVFPWIQVSAAMLCCYMVFNKVNSPQYILWLLPFFILIAIPLWLVLAYIVTDILLFFSYFWSAYYGWVQTPNELLANTLSATIWLRILLLLVLVVAFLSAKRTAFSWLENPSASQPKALTFPSAELSTQR